MCASVSPSWLRTRARPVRDAKLVGPPTEQQAIRQGKMTYGGEGRVDFPTPPAAYRRIRPRRASTITTSKNVRTPI
jgi:hypothetical protein